MCSPAGHHIHFQWCSNQQCIAPQQFQLLTGFEMMLQPQSMTADEMRTTKTHLFAQVLGTDMKKHFDILSRFQVGQWCYTLVLLLLLLLLLLCCSNVCKSVLCHTSSS